jgi:chromate transport protein ChrA
MEEGRIKQVKRSIFLMDVVKLALTAVGGPEMHFALFLKKLVQERKYIT